jgi:hypothetical protein
MSRKRTYNHNRFDGGMTDDIRNTSDLSKCAYVSHFDIYRNPNELHVLPGYVDDMSYADDADGMKTYDIRAIRYVSGALFGVGTKSDGTGSKLFTKSAPTDTNWTAVANGEGTDNLASSTFLTGTTSSNLFWVTIDSTNDTNVTYYNVSSTTDSHVQLAALGGDPSDLIVSDGLGFDDTIYATKGGVATGLSRISGATFTATQKTTSLTPADYQSGNEQYGIFGYRTTPSRAQLLLWDSASSLIDQKIEFGAGRGYAVGYPSGYWVGVVNEGLDVSESSLLDEQSNDTAAMSIKVASGRTAEKIYRIYAPTTTNGKIMPTRAVYRDAMLFYARVPIDATPTEYRQGLWAVGKCQMDSPLAVSVPFDTSSLGVVNHVHNFGNHYYFIHADDGSISRLDTPDGTYDVPATIETLIYGADTPYLKQFEGISILTENLPASGSVVVSYRTDLDDSWTTLGTSSTTGTQTHNFTRASGVPIGKFREIQFKIVATGKIVLKSYFVAITELDNLPFSV